MEESELTKALAAVQADLPKIGKDNTADTGKYSYKYADLGDISEQILPLLAKNGLAWLAKPTMHEGMFVLHYKMRHTSGEVEEGFYPLGAPNGRPQDQGSAITYARRYTLSAVVGVVPDEDDDGAGAEQQYQRNQQQPNPRSQGGNPQRSGGAAATTAPKQNGNGQSPKSTAGESMQSFMLKELQGPQRPAFLNWMSENYPDIQITMVPFNMQKTIEDAINKFACGEVPTGSGDPF